MFRHEPRIPFVPALREQVRVLVASINQPQVSIPGKPAQAAQGHLCVVRNGNGTLSVYVGFHLVQSGDNVVYVNDPHQLAAADCEAAQADGVHLLESMGFILDDVHFDALAPAAQEDLLARTPLFTPPRAAAPPPPAPRGPGAAIGRLLASF